MDNIPVFKEQHAREIQKTTADVFDDIHMEQVSFQEERSLEPDLDFMGFIDVDDDDGDDVSDILSDNSDA